MSSPELTPAKRAASGEGDGARIFKRAAAERESAFLWADAAAQRPAARRPGAHAREALAASRRCRAHGRAACGRKRSGGGRSARLRKEGAARACARRRPRRGCRCGCDAARRAAAASEAVGSARASGNSGRSRSRGGASAAAGGAHRRVRHLRRGRGVGLQRRQGRRGEAAAVREVPRLAPLPARRAGRQPHAGAAAEQRQVTRTLLRRTAGLRAATAHGEWCPMAPKRCWLRDEALRGITGTLPDRVVVVVSRVRRNATRARR